MIAAIPWCGSPTRSSPGPIKTSRTVSPRRIPMTSSGGWPSLPAFTQMRSARSPTVSMTGSAGPASATPSRASKAACAASVAACAIVTQYRTIPESVTVSGTPPRDCARKSSDALPALPSTFTKRTAIRGAPPRRAAKAVSCSMNRLVRP